MSADRVEDVLDAALDAIERGLGSAMRPFLPLFRADIRSLAFIPPLTRGRPLGKFMVYFADPHTYTSQRSSWRARWLIVSLR